MNTSQVQLIKSKPATVWVEFVSTDYICVVYQTFDPMRDFFLSNEEVINSADSKCEALLQRMEYFG